jgi:dTMP kinase
MNKGLFIVVEGMEGAGKSTIIQAIKEFLDGEQIVSVFTREPGGTELGEKIRAIIKADSTEEISARSELLLMYASRVQLFERVIYPALLRGDWVIADRFELSSYAYQGGGRQLDKKFIQNLSFFCLQGFKPDLTFFLDVPPEEGMQRAKARGAFDRIEQESSDFFARVYHSYLEAIQTDERICSIDATKNITDVKREVLAYLEVKSKAWKLSRS